jgi:uncharacterized protein YodC (DUF2158 family)
MIEPLIEPVTFDPGDVVALKSGGPAMMVIGVKEDGVHCLWYADAADEVKTAVVPAICVEKAIAWEDDDEDEEDDGKHRKQSKKKRHDDD